MPDFKNGEGEEEIVDEQGRTIEQVRKPYIERAKQVKKRLDILLKHFNATTILELNEILQKQAKREKGLKCEIDGREAVVCEVDSKGNVYFITSLSQEGAPRILLASHGKHGESVDKKYSITSDVFSFIDRMAEEKEE